MPKMKWHCLWAASAASVEGLGASEWDLRAIKLLSTSQYNTLLCLLSGTGICLLYFGFIPGDGHLCSFLSKFSVEHSVFIEMMIILWAWAFYRKKLVFITLATDSDPYPKRADPQLSLDKAPNYQGLLIWWWNVFLLLK